jgi:hypothetical protein
MKHRRNILNYVKITIYIKHKHMHKSKRRKGRHWRLLTETSTSRGEAGNKVGSWGNYCWSWCHNGSFSNLQHMVYVPSSFGLMPDNHFISFIIQLTSVSYSP